LTKDEALEFIASHNFDGADDRAIALMAKFFVYRAKEALAQPVQEPDELAIAYMSGLYDGKKKRPWVGLTEEERHYIALGIDVSVTEILLEAEAKLKEKNFGSR